MSSLDGNLNTIDKLLTPESVAVVGASNAKGKVGNIIFEGLKRSKARLYPVNPHEDVITGHKSYPQISDLPGTVDVAVITVQAEKAVDIAELAVQLIHEGCQLDINPIVWSRDRWVALDVKAIIAENDFRRSF